jgi:hypothetical protein
VVYKVNHEMLTRRYDEYMERHEDDDVVELATHDVELMEEEPGPSK